MVVFPTVSDADVRFSRSGVSSVRYGRPVELHERLPRESTFLGQMVRSAGLPVDHARHGGRYDLNCGSSKNASRICVYGSPQYELPITVFRPNAPSPRENRLRCDVRTGLPLLLQHGEIGAYTKGL